MSASQSSDSSPKLSVIGPVVGLVVGSIGMWWTMEDRLEKRVAEKVKLEARVARIEERITALTYESRQRDQAITTTIGSPITPAPTPPVP